MVENIIEREAVLTPQVETSSNIINADVNQQVSNKEKMEYHWEINGPCVKVLRCNTAKREGEEHTFTLTWQQVEKLYAMLYLCLERFSPSCLIGHCYDEERLVQTLVCYEQVSPELEDWVDDFRSDYMERPNDFFFWVTIEDLDFLRRMKNMFPFLLGENKGTPVTSVEPHETQPNY